jgi:pSer/pThr/pTyr-binding forkhead associated (FHA) protein
MELKLIVLAGAKEGTQIPLKKDKFVIGRAAECTLRAGSEAISRRHCAILRSDGVWVARDLGSRNGTYVNDYKIESPTPLAVGDELRVGPLKFRVEEYVKHAADKQGSDPKLVKTAAAAAVITPAAAAEPQDINRSKQPRVKNVSEVIERTVSKIDSLATEDDVSRWLLGISEANSSDLTRETTSFSMEDTTTIARKPTSKPAVAQAVTESPTDVGDEPEIEVAAAHAEEAPPESGSGGWNLFKKSKGALKKVPGKLPPRPADASKDSREAAAEILREMTRRR